MSESIARKVQPFTIGTKLSAPAVPKSPDFTPQSFHLHPLHHHPQHHLHQQHHHSNKSLDNRTPASCNLNDNTSLYLSFSQGSQVAKQAVSVLPPTVRQTGTPTQAVVLAVAVQPQPAVVDMAEEDQLNQNVLGASTTTTTTTTTTTATSIASATSTTTTTAVSRSIKKITISGSRESSLETQAASRLLAQGSGKALPGQNTNNNNNNNRITDTARAEPPLPAIVGVSCENKPGSHFKVTWHDLSMWFVKAFSSFISL